MKLLHVDSSILGPGSVSRELTALIMARLTAGGGAEVIYRDLAAEALPHMSAASLPGAHPLSATAEPQDDAAEDDLVLEAGGQRVLVDPVSLPFLAGATIDWSDELIGARFTIDNPNASSSCGCGTSFSV